MIHKLHSFCKIGKLSCNFWKMTMSFRILIVFATSYVCLCYLDHIYNEPCYASYLIGEMWINESLTSHEKWCFNTFIMNQNTFNQLYVDLGNNHGLRSLDRMPIWKKWVYFCIYSRTISTL